MKTDDYIGIGILGLGVYGIYKLTSSSTGSQLLESFFPKPLTKENIIANSMDSPFSAYPNIPSKEISTLDSNKLLIRNVKDGQLTTYKIPVDSLSEKEKSAISQNRFVINDDTLKYTYTAAGAAASKALKTVGPRLTTAANTATALINPIGAAAIATAKAINDKKIVTKTVSTPMQNITYKGTAAQIAVGSTIDKAKSLISSTVSSISKKLKK